MQVRKYRNLIKKSWNKFKTSPETYAQIRIPLNGNDIVKMLQFNKTDLLLLNKLKNWVKRIFYCTSFELYNFPFSFGFNFLACSWNEDKMPHSACLYSLQVSNLIYYYVSNVLVIVHAGKKVLKFNKKKVETNLKPHLKHMHRSVFL
jgi:hypothetical protein